MSRVVHVDVVGGAAGDMLVAALIDAGAPLEIVRDAVESVLPGRFELDTEVVVRGGIRARRLSVRRPGREAPPGPLARRPFRDLLDVIEASPLAAGVAERARSILEALGRAESRVHGLAPDRLMLHELGDDDTLLDAVGIAAALEGLEVRRLFVSEIPLGTAERPAGGHAHGHVSLPATATLELLAGFRIRGAGTAETVTPTAAAVFAACGEPAAEFPAMTVEGTGYGAGTDDPPDRPNVVRVVLGTSVGGTQIRRELRVLEANLDDLTPELVADAAEALRRAGALDVWTTPIHMKKGRVGTLVSALCDPAREEAVGRVFFEATTTFGVRSLTVRRLELDRRVVTVRLESGTVRVKVGLMDGRVMTAAPEHDDVAALAARSGRPVRRVYEEAAEAARRSSLAGATW